MAATVKRVKKKLISRPRGSAREDGEPLHGISSAAVAAKTGKTWPQWLNLLDAAGAKKLDHKGIVKIAAEHGAGPWWQQMVTVGYEQARGLREKNQTTTGYQISVTKTLPVSLALVSRAWTDEKMRRRWLGERLTIRKATAGKSIHITWSDGSNVEVMFYPQPSGRNRVTVQHNRLKSKSAAEKARAFWKAHLEKMQQVVT